MMSAAPSEVQRFSPTVYAGSVIEALKGDGIAIIEGAASPQSIDNAMGELGAISGDHLYELAGRSKTFATELLMKPL